MGTRLTGLASGMDIDSMVESMLGTKQSKVDEAKKSLQYLEWQQEAYRNIIGEIKDFHDTFFDILNRDTYLMGSSSFNSYTAAASINGASTSAVTVSATSSATTGTHTISNITKALNDVWTGSNIASMEGSGLALGDINSGDTIDVTLDGIKKTITLDGGYGTINDLMGDLQSKIDTAFGSGKVTVGTSGSELSFEAAGHVFRVTDTNEGDTVLTSLGFSSGDQNVLKKYATLGDANFTNDIFGAGDTISFSINGETFTFDKTGDTVQNLIDEVNSSTTANVTLTYSELTNSFKLASDSEGANNKIQFEDITGGFLTGLGIDYDSDTGHTQTAADATFTLDGVTTTRTSNTFTIDGVKYVLNEDTASEITVTVSTDTSDTEELILDFVDRYNELMESINDIVKEKRDRDFEPLTEAQREEMSEEEIEKWEEKAKSGVLRNDSLLTGLMSSLRRSLISTHDSLGISLMDLGITTSKDYTNGGQLIVDKEKLKETLESDPDGVKRLFTDTENGLGIKMDYILEDYVKSTGSDKGLLLKKAGMEGTTTETENILSKQIERTEDKVDTLLEKLEEAEEKYYLQFSAMESAIQEMNAMSNYISGWFM